MSEPTTSASVPAIVPYVTTAAELFAGHVPALLRAARVDLGGPVLFEIGGDGGGTWLVDFTTATVTANAPAPTAASPVKAIVRAQERDFMALVEGRMSVDDGLLTGRLALAGDTAAIALLMSALTALRSETTRGT